MATLAASGSAALVGCTSESLPLPPPLVEKDAAPRRGGTLRFSLGEDVKTLDPARTIDQVSLIVGNLMHDTLLDFAPSNAPNPTALVPSLASSWSVSEDGKTLQFELREGVRFSDGQPVLAEDYAYGFDRLLAPETASPAAQFFRGIDGATARVEGHAKEVRGIRVLGPRTLEIHLERPDPSFPLLLALVGSTPQKRSHVERVGQGISERPLGTGPFVLREFRPAQEVVLDRNPFYWNGDRPYLDSIRLRLNLPRETMLFAFLHGELDILDGRICSDAILLAREPAWAPFTERMPLPGTTADAMNTRRKPFDDKRVRQAFNYAISKTDTERLSNGRAIPANGYLPPTVPGHDASRPVWPHDPAKARKLLTEAGYARGLEVTFTTLRDEMAQKIALSMQADLAKVGVRMNIETLTFPAYINAVMQGHMEFAFSSWTMDVPDPWDFLEVKFHSRMIDAGTNDSRYANPEVDRLLDAARTERNVEKRLSMYRQAENIIVDDCPHVWHYFLASLDVRKPHVRGPIRHPARDIFLRDTYLVGA
ncbi:MAG: ABC transporter substrate-binding protein [Polyangiaceae bacterium]|nr:ABC transporter substrate-binding protein [Polyangiaceae bacterium]